MTLTTKHSLYASATLLLLLLAPSASAATPAAPSAVVAQVEAVRTHSAPPSSYDSDINVTWRLSADDPDQLNGTYNYTVWFNSTSNTVNGGCTPGAWTSGFCSGWIPLNFTKGSTLGACTSYAPIPGRPGWVGGLLCGFQGPQQPGDVRTVALNVTAWDGPSPGALPSLPSCLVNVTAEVLGNASATSPGHSQCGQPIVRAPRSLLAQMAQPMNRTIGASVQLRWNVSEDDPDQTNGTLNYRLFLTTNQYNTSAPGADLGLDVFGTGDASPPGIRYQLRNISSGDPFVAQFQVRVEDPLTHQWANLSCMVLVDLGQYQGADSCGATDIPITAGDSPSFPFMDVEGIAQASGLDVQDFAWLIGGVLVLVGLIVGALVAGPLGAFAATGMTIAWAATLFLFPWWFVVLVFLLAMAVVVLVMSRGGGQPA